MKSRTYWKTYMHEADADEIERNMKLTSFVSGGHSFELVCFEKDEQAPNILVVPGSGAHAYVYAELGYFMHLKGYNVFIMPKHGSDHSIAELMKRCSDAIKSISSSFGDRVGVVGGGLGGFVTFYLALAHGPMKSIVCDDSPGILTEEKFQGAIMQGKGAAKRRKKFFLCLRF